MSHSGLERPIARKRDATLARLMERHLAMPFPPACRGEAIDGIDLVLVGSDVYGSALRYIDNGFSLAPEEAEYLDRTVPRIAGMFPKLPDDEAKAYFRLIYELAAHLLVSRQPQADSRDIHQR